MNVTLRVNGERVLVQGRMHALIESRSHPGTWHAVSYDDQVWSCTCKSGEVRKTCRHIDALRSWVMGRARVEVEDPDAS